MVDMLPSGSTTIYHCINWTCKQMTLKNSSWFRILSCLYAHLPIKVKLLTTAQCGWTLVWSCLSSLPNTLHDTTHHLNPVCCTKCEHQLSKLGKITTLSFTVGCSPGWEPRGLNRCILIIFHGTDEREWRQRGVVLCYVGDARLHTFLFIESLGPQKVAY